jgi:outer membrane protein assembly factor BamB
MTRWAGGTTGRGGIGFRGVVNALLAAPLLLALASGCDLSSGSSSPVRIVWSYPLSGSEGGWIGVPSLSGSQVIAQTGPFLRAFDLTNGNLNWATRLTTGAQIGAQNVATAGGRAFVAGADSVYAVDAATGQRLWAFLPDAQGALCQITADTSAVFVGTRSHRVYALTADSGHVLWNIDIGPSWTNPGFINGIIEAGDTLYVTAVKYLNASGGLRTAQILAMTRDSGRELWRYSGPDSANDANGAASIAGDLALVADLYGHSFFAVSRFSGIQSWRVSTTGLGPIQAPVVGGTFLYVGGEDNFAYSTTVQTGSPRWKVNVGGSIDYVALCGRVLLVNDLELRVLDATHGGDLQTLLTGQGDDFPTSAFAVQGTQAFVVGNAGAYGLTCPN